MYKGKRYIKEFINDQIRHRGYPSYIEAEIDKIELQYERGYITGMDAMKAIIHAIETPRGV